MSSAADGVGAWTIPGIVRRMVPLLAALSVLELGSGLVLDTYAAFLAEYRVLAVLVPVMIGTGGNLGAILSARLSTRLHLGTLSFDPRDPVLWVDVLATLALAATVFGVTGLAAFAIGHLLGEPMGLVDLLVISLGSGMLLALVASGLSIGATYASYRFGVDPDETTIPVVTNVTDVLGVVILFAVALTVLR
ncbi:magnesium transporter [Natronoarchaeum mannanilyticum]|uniref:Magnesium transporter n=1 Tax=Natronoarchaeum mannanilyticum TaxID=926360 RepID=A0AAV3T8U9_9EURY